jgi:hypothetical protein
VERKGRTLIRSMISPTNSRSCTKSKIELQATQADDGSWQVGYQDEYHGLWLLLSYQPSEEAALAVGGDCGQSADVGPGNRGRYRRTQEHGGASTSGNWPMRASCG